MAQVLQPANVERLIKFQRDLLWQATLMEPQGWANDNDATGRVIDSFAEQVLTKPALLALDHVRQTLERPVAGSQDGPLAAIVVEESVNRLLQHPLFIADDDLGGIQVNKLLEPVVPVDDAAVEVIEVAGGKIATVEHDKWTQVGGDDGDDIEDHPLGLVFAVTNGLHNLQSIDEVFLLLL